MAVPHGRSTWSLGGIALHAMFELFGRNTKGSGAAVAHQPPGLIFPWPQGTVLTAIDEAVIALPMAIFGKDEPIGSVFLVRDDIQIGIPKEGDTFFIRLQPGMSVSLTKSCQAYVVAEDKQPRRFRISGSHVNLAVAPNHDQESKVSRAIWVALVLVWLFVVITVIGALVP